MPSKKEMQQAYRLKETQGFQDLHCALQAVDPQPIQRDIARYQLLIMAAERLKELAREKQELSQQLSSLSQQNRRPPPNMYAPDELTCAPNAMFSSATFGMSSAYGDGCMPYAQGARTSTFNVVGMDTNAHHAYYGTPYHTGRRG